MSDQTESSIGIDAPAHVVMDVIADLEAYPEWNEEFSRVEVLAVGDDADQRPLEARVVLDSNPIRDTLLLDYEWDGDSEVRWTLAEEAQLLRRLDGSYVLVDNGDGTTQVVYRLAVDLKMPMIGMLKRKAEKVVIERALRGLKKRVES
ncbi:SRPBCC family protein [Motilibacter aurantiacus]|uniref:SRPBCC family protein n=1 Tax=Motilibacter aurantiacus TaxID=2714955 RepID=UPI00140AEC57|nr:SRPBCC family protein [Motilibacter aurantiacus]